MPDPVEVWIEALHHHADESRRLRRLSWWWFGVGTALMAVSVAVAYWTDSMWLWIAVWFAGVLSLIQSARLTRRDLAAWKVLRRTVPRAPQEGDDRA